MEFDQEIKMKQRWINTRMKLLHNLLPNTQKHKLKEIIHNFMVKLQPKYPQKISVNYDRGGEAIPMPMDSGEPIPLEMFKGEPIPLYQEGAEVNDISEGNQDSENALNADDQE